MSDPITITIDAARFGEDMDKVLAKLDSMLPETMERVASQMLDYAQVNAPVDTGTLKDRLEASVEKTDSDISAVVGTSLEYAPYQEYGTGDRGAAEGGDSYKGHTEPVSYTAGWGGVSPHPYLRPALYDMQDVYIQMVEQTVDRACRE